MKVHFGEVTKILVNMDGNTMHGTGTVPGTPFDSYRFSAKVPENSSPAADVWVTFFADSKLPKDTETALQYTLIVKPNGDAQESSPQAAILAGKSVFRKDAIEIAAAVRKHLQGLKKLSENTVDETPVVEEHAASPEVPSVKNLPPQVQANWFSAKWNSLVDLLFPDEFP